MGTRIKGDPSPVTNWALGTEGLADSLAAAAARPERSAACPRKSGSNDSVGYIVLGRSLQIQYRSTANQSCPPRPNSLGNLDSLTAAALCPHLQDLKNAVAHSLGAIGRRSHSTKHLRRVRQHPQPTIPFGWFS